MGKVSQVARPPRVYATGPWVRSLRIAAVVGFVAVTAYVALSYPGLPETVPTHFDVAGQAGDYGPRSSVLWLAGVMLTIGVALAWLSTKPRVFNYPVAVTQENAQHLYREGERLMVSVLVVVLVIYLGAVQSIVAGAGSSLLVIGLIAMAASMMTGLIRVSMAESRGAA